MQIPCKSAVFQTFCCHDLTEQIIFWFFIVDQKGGVARVARGYKATILHELLGWIVRGFYVPLHNDIPNVTLGISIPTDMAVLVMFSIRKSPKRIWLFWWYLLVTNPQKSGHRNQPLVGKTTQTRLVTTNLSKRISERSPAIQKTHDQRCRFPLSQQFLERN